jgi:hypothetical protein
MLEDCGLARLATPETHVWTGYEPHAIDGQLAFDLWTVTRNLLQDLGYPTDGAPPAAQ